MKTAELNTTTAYMHRKGQYGSERPVLVLEARNWTEKDTWTRVDGNSKKIRVIRRSEKGVRVGSGRRGYIGDYKMTGIPVLRLGADSWNFKDGGDPDSTIIDDPAVLLQEALKLHNGLELVDTEQNVFDDGKAFRRVSVDARYADGQIRTVTVEFDLVRPQDLHQEWDAWIKAENARKLQEAQWAQEKAERHQVATRQAYDISSRVTDLMGDEPRYDHNGERYDLRRKSGSTSTYEISHELLVKLLGMAEGSSTE